MKNKELDLAFLVIDKIIVHDIPKHKKFDIEIRPNYSEQECESSDAMKSIFKDKIVSASKRAFKICFDDNQVSPVPLFVKEILKGVDVFVANTKKIADRLLSSQDGVNAAGILLIIAGKIKMDNVCVIMKLERDKGVQLKLNPVTQSFDLKDVDDLMLTQKTKLYKVAFFFLRENFNFKYDGILADFQINMVAKKEISTYFMNNFLGCRPYEDPSFSTKRFYNLTRAYIDIIEDEIIKAKYIQDLNSYIQKNQSTINPKEFVDDYFDDSGEKERYKSYLKEKGFAFDATYVKNTSLIEKDIKRITVSFENDISLIGTKGTLNEKVKFEKLANGQHRAEIISRIKKVI